MTPIAMLLMVSLGRPQIAMPITPKRSAPNTQNVRSLWAAPKPRLRYDVSMLAMLAHRHAKHEVVNHLASEARAYYGTHAPPELDNLGPMLRARTLQGQRVEARVGCQILNRMTALGMPESHRVG